jgi:hypothetical protein
MEPLPLKFGFGLVGVSDSDAPPPFCCCTGASDIGGRAAVAVAELIVNVPSVAVCGVLQPDPIVCSASSCELAKEKKGSKMSENFQSKIFVRRNGS